MAQGSGWDKEEVQGTRSTKLDGCSIRDHLIHLVRIPRPQFQESIVLRKQTYRRGIVVVYKGVE